MHLLLTLHYLDNLFNDLNFWHPLRSYPRKEKRLLEQQALKHRQQQELSLTKIAFPCY